MCGKTGQHSSAIQLKALRIKAGQVWQDQECPLHTIMWVVNLGGNNLQISIQWQCQRHQAGVGRPIVGCQVDVWRGVLMCLRKSLAKACRGMALLPAPVATLYLGLLHWSGPILAGTCTVAYALVITSMLNLIATGSQSLMACGAMLLGSTVLAESVSDATWGFGVTSWTLAHPLAWSVTSHPASTVCLVALWPSATLFAAVSLASSIFCCSDAPPL